MNYSVEQQIVIKNVDNAIFGMSIGLHDISNNNIEMILKVCRDTNLLGWLETHPVSILGLSWSKIVQDFRKENK
jgi:hypothetical protein